jgi:thiol-disulfide isomerase/thioredoxin
VRRRTLVVAAVAGGGTALGIGVALWQARKRAASVDVERPIDLWALSFASVDGPPLSMAALHGHPLLLNFWATWCVPCATEMPLLDSFARAVSSRGWNVLALAIDSAEPVRGFLAKRSLTLPVALGGAQGLDLSRSLGNTIGALPFTVAFATSGAAAQRKLGPVDRPLLDSWTALVQ